MSGPLSRVGGDVEPFRQLWATVLSLAVDDLIGLSTDRTAGSERVNHATRARAWFTAELRAVGSFIWICHILDLDPDRTRKLVLQRIEGRNRRLAA